MFNIVLSDGDYDEMVPFMKGLNSSATNISYRLIIHKANWGRTGKWSEVRRYLKYFIIPFKYFVHRKNYDIVIGWQQFYALLFSFYCAMFHVKKTNRIVALNYTYKEKKGILSGPYKWFMHKCTNTEYLDYIHVNSREYADYISREFNYPRERIIAVPFGVMDEYSRWAKVDRPEGFEEKEYFLSIGRSNRDYDFLIDSWDGLDSTLVIISDTYVNKNSNPNIIIKNDITGEAQYPWIANCKAVIIPIENAQISSGDTVLLASMSLKKIVLVSNPSTLSEMYIKSGENGLAFAKDKDSLKKLIIDVLQGKYDYICENARKCFLEKYTREQMAKSIAEGTNF